MYAKQTATRAIQFLHDWKKANDMEDRRCGFTPSNHNTRWAAPPTNFFKCNDDASLSRGYFDCLGKQPKR